MASDIFLKIKDIDGESTDKGHEKWMEIESFSWGAHQAASSRVSTAGGATSARADFGDLSVVKMLDSASPNLALACASGKHIDEVTLELNRAAGDSKVKYMEYKLNDVIISSISVGGGGSSVPVETLSLNYAKISWTYTMQKRAGGGGGGNVAAGWDLTKNVKI
ncbi:MAG TPA: type VI secretion system tube protein Hcp [Desulfomonilia bacterium]|nr:type VI secretion system tube protein Hcp [Desulfomonilia bacterium]